MNRVQIKCKSPEGYECVFDVEETHDRHVTTVCQDVIAWLKENKFQAVVYSRSGSGAGKKTQNKMVLDTIKNRVKLYGWFGRTAEERQPFFDAIAEAVAVKNLRPTFVIGDKLEEDDKPHYWLPIQFAPQLAAHDYFKDFEKPTLASLAAIHDNQ